MIRDFAGFTSQQYSNLVWGGIKYAETTSLDWSPSYCKSRNELLDSFPSTVQNSFLTTITRNFRFPYWMMYAGSWLYCFGRSRTEIPKLYNAAQVSRSEPLIKISKGLRGIEIRCAPA